MLWKRAIMVVGIDALDFRDEVLNVMAPTGISYPGREILVAHYLRKARVTLQRLEVVVVVKRQDVDMVMVFDQPLERIKGLRRGAARRFAHRQPILSFSRNARAQQHNRLTIGICCLGVFAKMAFDPGHEQPVVTVNRIIGDQLFHQRLGVGKFFTVHQLRSFSLRIEIVQGVRQRHLCHGHASRPSGRARAISAAAVLGMPDDIMTTSTGVQDPAVSVGALFLVNHRFGPAQSLVPRS